MWSLLFLAWIPFAVVIVPTILYLLPVLVVVSGPLFPVTFYLGLSELVSMIYPRLYRRPVSDAGGHGGAGALPAAGKSEINANSRGGASTISLANSSFTGSDVTTAEDSWTDDATSDDRRDSRSRMSDRAHSD